MNPRLLRYAITDRVLLSRNGQKRSPVDFGLALQQQAARLVADGVDFLQLREKDLHPAEIATLSRALLDQLRGSSTRLLLNSRADIAVATAAHGVHLTSAPDELTPAQVHDLYAQASLPPPVVTLSCHSLEDVVRHRLEPLTAILFGPVFEKSVSGEHRAEGSGLTALHQACEAARPLPVLALGGVTSINQAACIQAGAAGVAGIRLFGSV
jgi:thiamine-phosphate pyrophosphorylase